MPLPKQTHPEDKITTKQQLSRADSENLDIFGRQPDPATIIQRARLDLHSLTPPDLLHLQHTAGNRGVERLLRDVRQRRLIRTGSARNKPGEADGTVKQMSGSVLQLQTDPAEKEPGRQVEAGVSLPERKVPEDLSALPLPGGQHQVMVQEVNGVWRIGIASEFTQVRHIVAVLLDQTSPLLPAQRLEVGNISHDVYQAEDKVNRLRTQYDQQRLKESNLRQEVTQPISATYGPVRNRRNRHHPKYDAYLDAIEKASNLWRRYLRWQDKALNLARDAIVRLWDIGKDFLPTHLMPVGEIFRDRAFGGDTTRYTYHTGQLPDPIPITWYKAPASYPRLQLPDNTIVDFGSAFSVGGKNFGLDPANMPRLDWLIQKTAHNETREGQRDFNQALVGGNIKVEKNGGFIFPPLGSKHQFDGDHVKDLGFGGQDREDNYWPLDSTVNRRAFSGYNANYIIHYLDPASGEHKSRAIGGLVGKWFIVKGFLGSGDPPVPNEGEAAGGTPKS